MKDSSARMTGSDGPRALVERFEVLAEAGRALVAVPPEEVEQSLTGAVGQAVTFLGDWAFLDLGEVDAARRLVVAPVAEGRVITHPPPPEPLREWRPLPDDPFGLGLVARTGTPEVVRFVDEKLMGRIAHSAEVEKALRELGFGSLVTVPLTAHGRLFGALTFVSVEPDKYAPEDLLLAEELGHLAALSLENEHYRRALAASRRSAENALTENARLQEHLVRVNESLLVSAVREQEEADEARQLRLESEALFRTIFDRAAVGIAVLDADGCIVDANPALERMLDRPRDALRGVRITEFAHEDDADQEWQGIVELLAGRVEPVQLEKRMLRRSGDVIWTNCMKSIARSGNRPIFIISLMEDITRRKSMEDELRHAQRMEAIGRLAGGIAHDFNNILMSLGGRAEIMMESVPEAGPMFEDLREMREGVERAARLTQQLLAFSRKQMLRPQILELGDVVGRMEGMLRPLVGSIRLTVEVAALDARVRADPTQVEQIVMNLVVNARDATPDGGEIDVRVDRETVAEERPNAVDAATPPGDYVVVSVRDSGQGIEPRTLPLILEPFFTTKEAGRGVGLGLSTVYGIVKQSGGFMDVVSEHGRGTTFRIYFPEVTGEATRQNAGQSASDGEDGRGDTTILVVEDEAAMRALVARVLEREGYRVLSAGGGEEALALFTARKGAVDLVVTDVMMPGMDGRELARALEERSPGTRTLFISGHEQVAVLEPEELGPGRDFLAKPFTPAELATKVEEALRSTASG